MSKRKKIIITIVSIFLIFLFFNLLKDEEVIDLNTFNKIEEEEKEIVLEYEVNSSDLEYEAVTKESARETNLELLLINLAKNFVERFGSWSTDNQGENLEELLPLSTAKMKQYLNNIILNYEITEFYGLSTKALATEIIFLDEEEGEAIILVKTQRIETLDDLSTEVYYQDIELYIILAGDKWLIEETKW